MAKAIEPLAIESILDTQVLEQKLLTLEAITKEALLRISQYLTRREIKFTNILIFIRNPVSYPGNPFHMQYIINHFVNKVVAEKYRLLQENGIYINFAFKTIFNSLMKGGKT